MRVFNTRLVYLALLASGYSFYPIAFSVRRSWVCVTLDVTGGQNSHITVTYKDRSTETSLIYAVSEDVSCELGRHIKNPTGKDLEEWLEKRGCQLDSSGGPAVVRRNANGSS